MNVKFQQNKMHDIESGMLTTLA